MCFAPIFREDPFWHHLVSISQGTKLANLSLFKGLRKQSCHKLKKGHQWPFELIVGFQMQPTKTRWWLKKSVFLIFTPTNWGRIFPIFDDDIFRWVGEKPPTRKGKPLIRDRSFARETCLTSPSFRLGWGNFSGSKSIGNLRNMGTWKGLEEDHHVTGGGMRKENRQLGCLRKLGSMVSKWVMTLLIHWIYGVL